MIKIKYPKSISQKGMEKFFIDKGLSEIVKNTNASELDVNHMKVKQSFKPELSDLYRLYQFVILNKRTTVLEFGSGWSSLIFNHALNTLKNKFSQEIKKLRRNNPFELFLLENEKKYLEITKKKINKFNKNIKNTSKVHYYFSDVKMTKFNGRFATEFENIPLCNPDFIYLDGPGQFNVKGDVNKFSTRHNDMMPMSCDILKFEYFLTPGTIIVVDGRGANSKFLLDNLKRKWVYEFQKKYDQHIFLLDDPILGKYNKRQLDFYSKKI
tara:strand:+ start:5572 stop:6375 length:804 start_codon:yes stop_codon:yes gene_type:complete